MSIIQVIVAMAPDDIIKKAKKKKRREEIAAPLMIMLGFFLIMFLVYIGFLYKRTVFNPLNLVSVDILCGTDVKAAEQYLYNLVFVVSSTSLGILFVILVACALLFTGVRYVRGNKERELLLRLHDK